MKTKRVQRNFRPWIENQEWLELAEKLGLNVSELINEVLAEGLKRHLEAKAKAMREALAD